MKFGAVASISRDLEDTVREEHHRIHAGSRPGQGHGQ